MLAFAAVVCFIAALISAAFGFGVVASAYAGIAQILFVVFLLLTLAALIAPFFSKNALAAGPSIRLLTLLIVGGLIAVGGYASMRPEMKADVQQSATQLSANASEALHNATN